MSTIERITITLTAETAQAVRGAVQAGEYASSSEIILDAFGQQGCLRFDQPGARIEDL